MNMLKSTKTISICTEKKTNAGGGESTQHKQKHKHTTTTTTRAVRDDEPRQAARGSAHTQMQKDMAAKYSPRSQAPHSATRMAISKTIFCMCANLISTHSWAATIPPQPSQQNQVKRYAAPTIGLVWRPLPCPLRGRLSASSASPL